MKDNSLSMTETSDLIELIELGFSNEEIQQYFPSISIGVIAAYRAHVTRGTYSGGSTCNPSTSKDRYLIGRK